MFDKKILKTVGILLGILVIIFAFVFFYFRFVTTRELFPKVQSTVKSEEYEQNGYKKIVHKDEKLSFFIPNYWTESDESLKTYSDFLNGSLAYINSYPNNLGILTEDLCKDFATKNIDELKNQDLYVNTTLNSAMVKKVGDFDGCYILANTTVNGKEYSLRQFFIFRKNTINQLFIQIPKLQTQEEIADKIERSVMIQE